MKTVLITVLVIFILVPLVISLAPVLLPIIIIVGVIFLRIKYPEIKGAVGEYYVNRVLKQLDSNYRIFHDLYLPNEKGGTTQIDHIVTSPYGIFVIETKHYDGWIFGSENQKNWTQVIYKRKEKFYNPIWQNYGHIQALKKYINREEFNDIHSIIAFSNQSKLKFKEDFKSAKVIQTPQLTRVIKECNTYKIGETELNEINRKLEGIMIEDKKEKKQIKRKHIVEIKNNLKEKTVQETEQISQNVCPKCGGVLSMKKGKYGSFYGCGNYPKCRYTKRISIT